jgi:cytidine deaminase
MKQKLSFEYDVFDDLQALDSEMQRLVEAAVAACTKAYAPYSQFHVGAAVRLTGGEILQGSNKENASFPAGTCAERNVLNYTSDHRSGQIIEAIAVSAQSESFELSNALAPCGICRQVICETEKIQGSPIQIIMHAPSGGAIVVPSAKDLLPFHFYLPQLKR